MSVGLRNTTIERFRKRFHPGLTLRLLALSPDAQELNALAMITKGYLITPNVDTAEGSPAFTLALDTRYTPTLTEEALKLSYMVELINVAANRQRRYRVDTDTLPQQDEWRYVVGLHAAYSDTKEVNGVYIPGSGGTGIIAYRYEHVQSVPATQWIVNHNLGEKVLAQVLNNANEVIVSPVITHVSLNQLTVDFDFAVTGRVRVL